MHEILDSDIVLNALNFIEVGEKWSNWIEQHEIQHTHRCNSLEMKLVPKQENMECIMKLSNIETYLYNSWDLQLVEMSQPARCVCVCACIRACACVHACVCVCICDLYSADWPQKNYSNKINNKPVKV